MAVADKFTYVKAFSKPAQRGVDHSFGVSRPGISRPGISRPATPRKRYLTRYRMAWSR
jgi:hypothetical protein